MKKYLFLLFFALFTIANSQTDLARWALTANGNVSYTDSRVNVSEITRTDNPTTFDSQGMIIRGWNNGNIEHYRFFGFSVTSNGGSIKISNLAFEQESLNPGPQNYTIRYYVSSNGSNVDDYNFLYNVGSTILVNNESIANNPIKNIPLNITLSGSQRLIVKFYSSGNNWNAGWRIKANTLKLTEVQATVPVANNDSYSSIYKNTSTNLNILSNDTSGSAFTGITITQQPAHGTVTVNGTTNVTYTPTAGYEGADTFKYRAVNATGSSNEATVSLNVIAAVPVANNDSYTLLNFTDTNLNILSNDTSALAYTGITITQQPAHGTVTVNGTNNVTYKSVAGYTGTDSFKYRVSNVTGASNEATVNLTVQQDPNTAVPVANNDSYTLFNFTNTNLNILSNDTSVLAITSIIITQQPTNGTVTVNGTSNVTYKSVAGYTGSDSFKYKSSNASGASNEATVSLTVQQDPNTAVPVANNDSFTAYKNNETSFNVLSNDTSVLAITEVTITQQPANGTLVVNGTTNVTYKPTTGYTGSDTFKYRASNSSGLSNEATANITVAENVNYVLARWDNSNFTPSFTNTNIDVTNVTSTQNISYVQNLGIGGGYNAFHTEGWPDKNAQTVDTSKYVQFTISPKHGYKLNLSEFSFQCVTEGGDAHIRVDYSLSSNFSNPKTILPETSISSTISTFSLTNFSKPIATDGQVLYLRIYVYNTWNAFQILLKNAQNVGPAFIGYTESSSTAPIAYDDAISNIVNNDIDINVLVNDDYSNKVTSLSYTQPSHGSTTLNANNTITYIPTRDYIGPDSFTYYITNEFGTSAPATVNISNNPNVTSPLVRWDRTNFTATAFQSFINSTIVTTNGGITIHVGGETNPKVFYVETPQNQNNTNFDASRYTQFVLENNSPNKTIEPKTFHYYASGSANAKYEIRYSKTADFSNNVVVMATGDVTAGYTAQNFTFVNGLKIGPGEKVYVRLYLYNSYYVQYKMQFLTGGMGPEIGGIFYNYIYASDDTIWLNPANPHWSNGTPTATKNAIVETAYNTSAYGNFESQNLTIRPTGTVTINAGGSITVNGQLVNNNTSANSFVIEHDANLLQNTNAQNTGIVTVKKLAIIPKMGYNYWSSPVTGQNLYQFSNGYNQAVAANYDPNGTPWNRFYLYNEANDYFVTSIAAEGISLNSSSTFLPARGYAIRGKNNFSETVTTSTDPAQFQFTGIPNNGDIGSYNLRWSGETKGYNMIGNPYPSNISFDAFYEQNQDKINGTAYFWTNNDAKITSQQSSGYSGNNYAIISSGGGVSATYFGYNNKKPNGSISVGQGFIVQAKESGKNKPLDFRNFMRTSNVANYYNRGAQKNRFWLEFKSPTDVNNEILIAYIANATNGYDKDYDADLLAVGSDSFWSVLDNRKLAIQSKNPNFNQDDVVRIAIKAAVSGNYKISLTDRDGIFDSNQSVYLKDKNLDKIVDITTTPYIFFTNSGQYEDRFEIVYKSSGTLGTTDNVSKEIIVTKDNQNFIVRSPENLDEVSIYDALGRLVYSSKANKKEILINKYNFAEGLYIVKAKSGNTITTKKVLK